MIKKFFNFGLNLGSSATAKSLYWVFSSNAISIGLTFFTTLIIARTLNKADNGIFLALFTYANLLSELGEAGLGSTLSNFIPNLLNKKEFTTTIKYAQTALALEIIIATGLTLGTLVLANYFSQILFAQTEILNIYLTAVMIFFMLIFSFALLILVAYKKFQKVAVLNIFYSLIRFIILIILLKYVQLTLTYILWVYLLAGVAAFFLGIFLIRSILKRFNFETNLVKQILGFSSLLALQKALVAISSRLDLLMLVPLAGAINAGVYGVASRFALVYPVLISSLGQVLGPKFSELESRQTLNIFFRKLMLLVALLLFSLVAFYYLSRTVIIWFLPNYIEAIPVLKGILFAYTSFILATPFISFIIFYLKKPQITVLTSGVQLLIILLANFYFLPRLGAYGPIAGIALGNLAVLIFAVFASWYYLRLKK